MDLFKFADVLTGKEKRELFNILKKKLNFHIDINAKSDERLTIDRFIKDNPSMSVRLRNGLKLQIPNGFNNNSMKYVDELNEFSIFIKIRNLGQDSWNEFKERIESY